LAAGYCFRINIDKFVSTKRKHILNMSTEEITNKVIGTLIGAAVLFGLSKLGFPNIGGAAGTAITDGYQVSPNTNKSPQLPEISDPERSTPPPSNYKQPALVRTRNGGKLNLRATPSETAPVVMQIPNGVAVSIIQYDKEFQVVHGESGKWCLVEANGKTGWAWGVYLQAQ